MFASSPTLSASTLDAFRLHDYEAAAAFLGMTPVALRNRVYRDQGPRQTVIGRRVFFSTADLIAFVEAHRTPVPVPVSADPPRRGRGRPSNAEKLRLRSKEAAHG